MHVRFSSCRGMPVLEEGTSDALGILDDILIDPDTGVVEGFLVLQPGMFFQSKVLYLSSRDIVHWGRAVRVRDHRCLADPAETVRAQALLAGRRRILHQSVRTQSGAALGRCRDVQIETRQLRLEWIFPRNWWGTWGLAVHASNIVEVTKQCVVVRDPPAAKKDPVRPTLLETVESIVEQPIPAGPPAVSRGIIPKSRLTDSSGVLR